MNTILTGLHVYNRTRKERVLAIEPDPARAEAIRDLVKERVGAECEVVATCADAIRAIGEQLPDLILTPAFLPPRDESALATRLRELPSAARVQVISVPPLVEWEAAATAASKVRKFLSRGALARPCRPDVVARQIEEYLNVPSSWASNTLVARGYPKPIESAVVRCDDAARLAQPSAAVDADHAFVGKVHKLGRAFANDRRGARRVPASELPWLWSTALPSGASARIVDVSNCGALIETTSKFAAGTALDLRLVGQEIDLRVPVRITRSEVAAVDSSGVRYRVAAAFASRVDIRGLEPLPAAAAAVKPAAVTDLLTCVLREMERGAAPAAMRSSYEQGLRKLVPVQDIRLRQKPIAPPDGCESIYFSVPASSGAAPVLQAIFESDYRLSADEFTVLKAAATLAATLLEFAPLPVPGKLLRPDTFDRVDAHRASGNKH
jgi:CheY-like chemotaxis protein